MQMPRGPSTTFSTDTNELDLAKAYEINPRVCKALTQGFLSRGELPFVLSAEETALVHDMDSTFVIGRSGTGKTTVMVLRMFAKAESAEDARCPQMLLTASPKLCLAIKDHFGKLRQNWRNGIMERGRLLTAAEDEEDTFLSIDDPPTLQALSDSDFPLFWTFGYLLRVLDRSLPGAPFWGFRKSSSELQYPNEVDWERFQTHYLHRMPSQAHKAFAGGSKLFAEIQTVIKGSLDALETGQPLALERYLQKWDTRNNGLSMDHLRLAYDCFEVYQSLLLQENEWDLNDAVQNLYARCESYPEVCESFVLETLAVDEVQDMNAISLALLKFLLNGPGACDVIHYAGDAAQVINSAANFRFADLKTLYYKGYLPRLAKTDSRIHRILKGKADAGQLVPRLKALTMNYRSVESIVLLGNATLAWMTDYFPESIDRLNPDHGLAQGGLPVFLELMSTAEFLARVVGTAETVEIGNIEFGADQAIIVRNAAAKQAVKDLVGKCAIVLDIKECKGLEFDDVILYNFFTDSTFKRWRVVDPNPSPRVHFDPLKDQLLLFELKQLYVAVTRARTNLWIYDQSERGTAVRTTLQHRQLVTTLRKAGDGEKPIPLAKRSTPEEWNQAGLRFFKQNNYEEALPCFVRSGNFAKEQETRAHIHVKDADQLEGLKTSSATRKAAQERGKAGDLFRGLGRYRLAATQYQTAGMAVSSAMLLIKAADTWAESGRTEATGQAVLRCLVLAGSPAYTKLLSALEMQWITRDDLYWRTVDTLAEKYGEEASNADIARIVQLFRTLEERTQFLEDLGKTEAVEDLLRTSGEWERLGLSYETRGELLKAEQAWSSARRADVLEKIHTAHTNLAIWVSRHQNRPVLEDNNGAAGVPLPTDSNAVKMYYEILEALRRSREWAATLAKPSNLTIEQVETIMKLVESVHSQYPNIQLFCIHLCSGGLPDPLLAEALGMYQTQNQEHVYLVANGQLSKWENRDFSPMVDVSPGYSSRTSSQIAKCLGRYCKEAAKTLERSVYSLTVRLWSWSSESTDKIVASQLKINAASAYGNHMLKFCVPDAQKLDEFILGLDRLLHPLVPQSRTPGASLSGLNGLSTESRQAFLMQIVSHRCDLREEADSNVIITALKWTCPGGIVFSLPPSDLLLINLINAMRWSTFTPSSGAQALAESALRLDEFLNTWAPQLAPRQETQSGSGPGKGWECETGQVPAAPDIPVVKPHISAKSQLYVFERMFFAIICLTDRFFETVLPDRLLVTEFTQGAQSGGTVRLLERKLNSLEHVDNTAYRRARRFQQIYQTLSDHLVGLLVNGQRLLNVLATFDPADRPVYIMRIITFTICLHCSRNLNSQPPTGTSPRTALFNLHDLLRDLSRTLPCDEVREILARTLSDERGGIGPCIQNLNTLADALGDPIRAVIDPLRWRKGSALGVKARSSIPKTYIRVSNRILEISETSDFGASQISSQKEITPTPDDDDREDTEPVEVEGTDFQATQRTLEEMEAEMKAATRNPIVWRYLMKWITRHRYEQFATKGLIATDKIAVLRIIRQTPDREIRKLLFDAICPAMLMVNGSLYEKGSQLLLENNKDCNTLKAVLQASGKGSPVGWLKGFRHALKALQHARKHLRGLLGESDKIKEKSVEIMEQSGQLIAEANAFDKEHRAVIDAFYKKKAAKA